MNTIFILCILCILFFGCVSDSNTTELKNAKDAFDVANTQNIKLEEEINELELSYAGAYDSFIYYQNKYEERLNETENDLKAMQDALIGFSECNVAVTCTYHKDYEYEGFACSELTESELNYYIDSCSYSSSYNEFYEYVEERSFEYG